MNILYISISGNTRGFVKKLTAFSTEQHEKEASLPLVHLKEIHENSDFEKETKPFFVFVPTYLEGGNGIDSGDQEILTETMREYLEYQENHTLCLGVVGSGNKNFNYQYCLTAKQYAEQFGFPMVEDYELRGTPIDVERIYHALVQRYRA